MALNPLAGLHVYVVAPLAVNITLSPTHISGLAGLTVIFKLGATVTVIFAVLLQPLDVPVTV